MRLQLRPLGPTPGGAFGEYEGDLSLGGVAVPLREGASHRRYEVLVPLPGGPLRAEAEPVSAVTVPGRLQLRFVDLDTAGELAIARFLDDLALGARSGR
jgi:hypothetical protein